MNITDKNNYTHTHIETIFVAEKKHVLSQQTVVNNNVGQEDLLMLYFHHDA